MSTDKLDGLEYSKTLFSALENRLSDIAYVQGTDASLKAKALAPTFLKFAFAKAAFCQSLMKRQAHS